ncbi:MAG: Gfo/Idh/MocA family oxidoreductase [Leptolyngbya sp. SIO4C1]|nr:Gfo/Idh/MocA family oxidoreductase [Leptolyngbya sp. SIO4C1]
MMAQISIVLLGAGRWGTHLLRNFLVHPQIRVRAVADPNPARLKAIAERFNLDGAVALLSDWQAALALEGIAAAAIATPAATHVELITAALKVGLHVLAEKPLTLDSQSAQALCQLAQQQQRQLIVDHTYLFHPAVMAGREAKAQLGALRYGYAARTHLGPVRQDVDALWDLAIHDIAIFNHWLGEQPQQVRSQGLIWQQTQARSQFSQGLADAVWCQLRYPSGFEAQLHLCWANPDKQRRLCLVGDQGTLIFDEMHSTRPLTLQRGSFASQAPPYQPQDLVTVALPVEPREPLRSLCQHFVDCLSQRPSDYSSGQAGADLVRVLEALSQSLYGQDKRPVKGHSWVEV